jgi:catechol 2,3-dioxygenase-like lactoylglutathione lyase family enzyme
VPVHINLTVSDVDRSVAFYRRWLGFGDIDRRFPDGTVFVRDAEGTDLALHAGPSGEGPPVGFHFGFRRTEASDVDALRRSLRAGGVAVIEHEAGPTLSSVRFCDPDGYVIEVYWEPSNPVSQAPL